MLSPVDKSSLSVEVANILRLGILGGTINPGQKLLEEELSRQMNTSRGPIRDAFIRLEHEGLVIREPNKSVTVVQMTEEDVEEIHSLRLSLELLALRYLCTEKSVVDLEPLRATITKLRECISSGAKLEEAVEIDLSFHEAIVSASGHRRLYNLWMSIKPQISFLISAKNIHALINFAGGANQHEELVAHIAAKDFPACKAALREHLLSVLKQLLKSYCAGPTQ
jgi:DNA-binding GntR family transcriptional regulator